MNSALQQAIGMIKNFGKRPMVAPVRMEPTPTPTPTATPTPTPVRVRGFLSPEASKVIPLTPEMRGFKRDSEGMYYRDEPTPPPGRISTRVTPTPTPTRVPVKIDPEVRSFLEKKVFPITQKRKIPKAIAAGMFAAEGRLSGLGASRNNYYNIGAYDSNVDNAFSYNTPEEGIQAYVDLMMTPRYENAWEEPTLEDILLFIQNAGYAGDPATYKQRADNGYDSYSEFIMNVPEYQYYEW